MASHLVRAIEGPAAARGGAPAAATGARAKEDPAAVELSASGSLLDPAPAPGFGLAIVFVAAVASPESGRLPPRSTVEPFCNMRVRGRRTRSSNSATIPEPSCAALSLSFSPSSCNMTSCSMCCGSWCTRARTCGRRLQGETARQKHWGAVCRIDGQRGKAATTMHRNVSSLSPEFK